MTIADTPFGIEHAKALKITYSYQAAQAKKKEKESTSCLWCGKKVKKQPQNTLSISSTRDLLAIEPINNQ